MVRPGTARRLRVLEAFGPVLRPGDEDRRLDRSSLTTALQLRVLVDGRLAFFVCAPGRLLQYFLFRPFTYVQPLTRKHVLSGQPWHGDTFRTALTIFYVD